MASRLLNSVTKPKFKLRIKRIRMSPKTSYFMITQIGKNCYKINNRCKILIKINRVFNRNKSFVTNHNQECLSINWLLNNFLMTKRILNSHSKTRHQTSMMISLTIWKTKMILKKTLRLLKMNLINLNLFYPLWIKYPINLQI